MDDNDLSPMEGVLVGVAISLVLYAAAWAVIGAFV